MEQRRMNAAERGTVYHAVMQHLPLDQEHMSKAHIDATMDQMVMRQFLTYEQRAEADADVLFTFFSSPLGKRLLQASHVNREVPFSYGLKAAEVYAGLDDTSKEEVILIQGVIDCLFEENGELVLLDYKTDAVYGDGLVNLVERYRLQVELYAHAIEQIWKRPVKERILYFFDGSHTVQL
jgi:ATP-dependent helicase/nuclease subunit A